tara:strand:+ start:5285 stop:5443 length:159 start_codon:yes stop_codon:yes gene_type:complete
MAKYGKFDPKNKKKVNDKYKAEKKPFDKHAKPKAVSFYDNQFPNDELQQIYR